MLSGPLGEEEGEGRSGRRGVGGEEWEGLLCQETERERENYQLSTAC